MGICFLNRDVSPNGTGAVVSQRKFVSREFRLRGPVQRPRGLITTCSYDDRVD